MQDGKDAANHLSQGKRHLLVQDYSTAVASLSEACQILDKKYGSGSDECGETYLYYGVALLELARQETGAIDGIVSANIHESSAEEEEEDDNGDEDENENENSNGDENENKEDDENEETETKANKTDTEEDIGESSPEDKKGEIPEVLPVPLEASNSTNIPGPSEPSTSKGPTKEDEDDDGDASTMEIAWEVLTMAKLVFTKNQEQSKETKLNLAETIQKLGEISIEWENYEQANQQLQESLSLRKEVLPEDDRLIAETYYHLGISFSFANECEKANDCFRSAIQVIEQRINNQSKLVTSENKEMAEAAAKEIAELKDILPDMKSRIEDSQDQMANAMQALKEQVTQRMQEDVVAAKVKEVQAKPISVVNHLVKRKNNTDDSNASKKVCTDGRLDTSKDEAKQSG